MSTSSLEQAGRETMPASADGPSAWIAAVAQERCRAAFARLFHAFAPRIKAQLIRQGLGVALAEEVAQETLLAIWRKAGQFNAQRASAEAWIYGVARNQRIDTLRREQRHLRSIFNDAAPAAPTPEECLQAVQDLGQVRTALAGLPLDQADLLQRSYYHDHSHSRIAVDLGMPLGTVKSRMRRATQHLRLMLADGIKVG